LKTDNSDNSKTRPVRVGLISLGCAKNLADAEIMLGTLLKDGLEVTNNASEADVVIVNTCSFIDSAQEESVDAILESDELREATNRGQGLIVSGCLPQRFREELPKLLPEVDAFMGIDQVSGVTNLVQTALARRRDKLAAGSTMPRRVPKPKSRRPKLNPTGPGATPQSTAAALPNPAVEVTARPSYIPDYATPRFRLTPRHFAYVKIAEGCNHPCSFCIIPRMRGSHRSRQQSDIVTEVRALIDEGVKEVNLISQDSTYYGMDLRANHRPSISSPENFHKAVQGLPDQATTICTLLRELNALPGDFWIRLLYTHPAHWTDELIRTIAECPKVARYVDIPLQHIHENMLERMRRETSQQHIVDLIKRIRAGIPGIALRTTFIVGFPGETQVCFEALLDFIRQTRFERLGVFTYSQQEGTRAGAMAGQIPVRAKSKRRAQAMRVQHEIAAEVARSFVGRTLKVLVENEPQADKSAQLFSWEHGLIRGKDSSASELHGQYLVARGEADAPDIDGRVYVRGKLPLGDFSEVKITGHTDYDLIAEPA
jgi:ribosomal protein S12 methylthiotransferase